MYAIGGIEDHVHVLLRFPPTLAIADLVGRMKGASSHMVTQVMGEPFKWQGAYGAFTLGKSGLAHVRDYVLNQEEHHRTGTTFPALEETSESNAVEALFGERSEPRQGLPLSQRRL